MAEINLRKQLEILVQLQSVDSRIYALKDEKTSKPEEIKALETAFETKKQKLAEAEKNYLDLQKQKKDKELELATKDESTKKLQGQLYSLKTNKEYQTMLQQISDSKADYSVIEDKIIAIIDQIDRMKQEVEQEKKVLQEQEKSFQQEKKKVEDRIKEIDGTLSQLDTERKRLIPDIDKLILEQYEKVLENRQGLAIVSVKDNSCLGCNMFVPPQVINLIKMYERIITCEVCNRILYVQDEPG